MHGRVVHAVPAVHPERHLDILDQPVVNAEIEIIHIAAPVAGRGNDPVRPAGIGIILLLIIEKIGIEFPHNVIFIAKHEQARRGRVLLSVGADADSAQLQEEFLILQ